MTGQVRGPILITGAGGDLGTILSSHYAKNAVPHRRLSLHPLGDDADYIGSVTDLDLMTRACEGASAVVHLGGVSLPGRPWRDYLENNIHGTWTVLEAARIAGVDRVVLASSNHAAGYVRRTSDALASEIPPRPDSLYGVSKAAVEALGAHYADEFGIKVTSLRIGSCFPRPWTERMLAAWLSPADFLRLVEAAVSGPWFGHRVVWGISRNTRRWWSLEEGEAIGYFPQDDAERFAASVEASAGLDYVGGGAPPSHSGLPVGPTASPMDDG